jgi:hypothetical protein
MRETLITLAVGLGSLAIGWATWQGHIRWRGYWHFVPTAVYVFFSFGLAGLLGTVGTLLPDDPYQGSDPTWLPAVGAVVLVAVVLLGVLALVGPWLPRRMLPSWWVEERAERDAHLDRSDPTAPTYALDQQLAAQAAALVGEPSHHWNANWVWDQSRRHRDHALAGAGSMGGQLTVRPDGIVFAANVAERLARGRSTEPLHVVLHRGELTGVWSVPARAGGDGVVPEASPVNLLRHSPHRRLVLAARDEWWVFEVTGAAEKADVIAALWGISRGADR